MFWKYVRRHVVLIYNIYLRRIKRWLGIYDTERLESELSGTDIRTMRTRMSETIIDGVNEIPVSGRIQNQMKNIIYHNISTI